MACDGRVRNRKKQSSYEIDFNRVASWIEGGCLMPTDDQDVARFMGVCKEKDFGWLRLAADCYGDLEKPPGELSNRVLETVMKGFDSILL